MRLSRRKVVKAGVAIASLSGWPFVARAIDSTVRGVQLGITTGSLNPLPKVTGRDPLDILIDECLQLDAANVELASGFLGPALAGAAVGGQVPARITPEYLQSRQALRRWRLSRESIERCRAVGQKFRTAGLNLFSLSNTFSDDVTDDEIDAMFREMQALGVKIFQTNQSRVSIGPRLAPFVRKYQIRPSFHTHSNVADPNEVASTASLQKLLEMSDDFMVCLDIGHFAAGNQDAVAYLREHHERITHIHVKDRKRDNGPNVAWGTGDTPIIPCLQLIRDNRWPIKALVEREFSGTGTPMEQTRRDLDYMIRALQS